MKNAIALVATLLVTPTFAQIYRCPDASGRTVIQQHACAGGKEMDVKPASGRAGAKPPSMPVNGADATAARPMTEAERLNAKSDASARERRRRELETIFVPDARARVYGHRDNCKASEQRLRDDQYRYVQNLYGKTHAAQVASEMAALSAKCDTQDRANVSEFNKLLEECKRLEGCKTTAL